MPTSRILSGPVLQTHTRQSATVPLVLMYVSSEYGGTHYEPGMGLNNMNFNENNLLFLK